MKRLFFLALLGASLSFGQALLTPPKMQFLDANGNPLAGGYVYTCAPGTTCTPSTPGNPPTNPQATYTDATLTVANANPIVLDSGGFANIWLGTWVYKIVVQSAAGVTQYSTDNVPGFPVRHYYGVATASAGTSAGSTGSGTLTWPFPFPDTNYSVSCQNSGTLTGVPVVIESHAVSASTFSYTVAALTANPGGAYSVFVSCTGVHN